MMQFVKHCFNFKMQCERTSIVLSRIGRILTTNLKQIKLKYFTNVKLRTTTTATWLSGLERRSSDNAGEFEPHGALADASLEKYFTIVYGITAFCSRNTLCQQCNLLRSGSELKMLYI